MHDTEEPLRMALHVVLDEAHAGFGGGVANHRFPIGQIGGGLEAERHAKRQAQAHMHISVRQVLVCQDRPVVVEDDRPGTRWAANVVGCRSDRWRNQPQQDGLEALRQIVVERLDQNAGAAASLRNGDGSGYLDVIHAILGRAADRIEDRQRLVGRADAPHPEGGGVGCALARQRVQGHDVDHRQVARIEHGDFNRPRAGGVAGVVGGDRGEHVAARRHVRPNQRERTGQAMLRHNLRSEVRQTDRGRFEDPRVVAGNADAVGAVEELHGGHPTVGISGCRYQPHIHRRRKERAVWRTDDGHRGRLVGRGIVIADVGDGPAGLPDEIAVGSKHIAGRARQLRQGQDHRFGAFEYH